MSAQPRRGEVRRKLIHAGTGVAAVWVLRVPDPAATLGLGAVCAAALGLEIARLRVVRVARALDRALPDVVRASEAHRLSGAFLLTVGYVLASALGRPSAAAAGILALALGDAAAALVGQAWANRRSMTPRASSRTWAGTAACFAVTFGAAAVVLPARWGVVLAAAVAAAVLERLDPWRMDNVSVPVGVAAVVELLLRVGV